MSNTKHALLSPSGASRWLACTPSARLEATFPDQAGQAAAEGTLAHKIGELLIARDTGKISKVEYAFAVTPLINDKLYSAELMGYVEDYAAFVIERFNEAQAITKDALLELEVKLPLDTYTGEHNAEGTGDNVIIGEPVLEIIDLKYGKGVEVSAEENKQMMLYALGALELYEDWYKIDNVRMTIYQPRIDNFSTWEISVIKLKEWANTVLKHRAALALAGKGIFLTGDHCQFCRAKAVCKANAEYQLEIAREDFAVTDPALISDAEVSDILLRAKGFESWLKAVKEHALKSAIQEGKKWPGLKLVEGRSKRVYSDRDAIAADLIAQGWKEEVIFKKELYGVTALTGILTKKVFDLRVSPYIVKPPGKPTLVAEDDKRPEINSADAARADFEIDDDGEE